MQKRISMEKSTIRTGAAIIRQRVSGISSWAAVSWHQLLLAALRSSAGEKEQSTQAPAWDYHSE
jgi:hypothetical protein